VSILCADLYYPVYPWPDRLAKDETASGYCHPVETTKKPPTLAVFLFSKMLKRQ
jgi:hypothetical protein